jgi:peptidyl-prolyl cis-trans isomerase D
VTGLRVGDAAAARRGQVGGHAKVGVDELGKTITTAFEQEREQNPTLTMKHFLARAC